MEVEIKTVTPEIRFALMPVQVIREAISSGEPATSSLLPNASAVATEQTLSTVTGSFPSKHLWWVISASMIIGAGFGILIYKQWEEKKKRLGR